MAGRALRGCFLCAALLSALLPLRAQPVAAALPESVTVSTLSGSGAPEFNDGASGSFLMPAGIAFDAHGTLYVVDAAAQRIRRVDSDGVIRTIAGGGSADPSGWWVPGAYRDGRGAQARFNDPQGIAIRRDGALYVADSLNHCIRKVLPDGTVTMYAGSPQKAAHVDGSQSVARFVRPTQIAVDGEDNLYVADYSGIRKIDRAGEVTTIPHLGVDPYGVAVSEGPLGVTIFVGDRFGIVARQGGFTNPKDDRRFVSAHARSGFGMQSLYTSADRPLGDPAYLTALDENTVAFTDARTNTVRLLEVVSGEVRILAGVPSEDASGNTGGYRDGAAQDAKFFAPLGITPAHDGALIVADSGNRRIRRLSPFDRLDPWAWLGLAYPGIESHPRAADYHIAFVGNSYIWYDTQWSDSIQGIMQSDLASDPFWQNAKQSAPRVIPIVKVSIGQVGKFLESAAQSGLYQMVILDLNWGTIAISFAGVTPFRPDPALWQNQLSDSLRAIHRRLSQKHIPFLVVTHPTPFEVSPSESEWLVMTYEPKANEDLAAEMSGRSQFSTALNAAVTKAGVPLLDLTPLISAQDRSLSPHPIFGAGDYHFTQYGRRIIGDAIAQKLKTLAPWQDR